MNVILLSFFPVFFKTLIFFCVVTWKMKRTPKGVSLSPLNVNAGSKTSTNIVSVCTSVQGEQHDFSLAISLLDIATWQCSWPFFLMIDKHFPKTTVIVPTGRYAHKEFQGNMNRFCVALFKFPLADNRRRTRQQERKLIMTGWIPVIC